MHISLNVAPRYSLCLSYECFLCAHGVVVVLLSRLGWQYCTSVVSDCNKKYIDTMTARKLITKPFCPMFCYFQVMKHIYSDTKRFKMSFVVSLTPPPPTPPPCPRTQPTLAAGEGRELPSRTRQNIRRLCKVSTHLMFAVLAAVRNAEVLATYWFIACTICGEQQIDQHV